MLRERRRGRRVETSDVSTPAPCSQPARQINIHLCQNSEREERTRQLRARRAGQPLGSRDSRRGDKMSSGWDIPEGWGDLFIMTNDTSPYCRRQAHLRTCGACKSHRKEEVVSGLCPGRQVGMSSAQALGGGENKAEPSAEPGLPLPCGECQEARESQGPTMGEVAAAAAGKALGQAGPSGRREEGEAGEKPPPAPHPASLRCPCKEATSSHGNPRAQATPRVRRVDTTAPSWRRASGPGVGGGILSSCPGVRRLHRTKADE